MMNKMNKQKANCENVKPYDAKAEKSEQVETMFNVISPSYDSMNTAISLGMHKRWRNSALRQVTKMLPPDGELKILDVATGTGDVAFELNQRFPNAQITGIDISDGMLGMARKKLDKAGDAANEHIIFRHGDSLDIRSEDNYYDLITVAYGVRNFENLLAGFREIQRVLRPGGVVCVIELSEPENPLIHAGYKFYSHSFIPRLGKIVSGDSRAYSYLLESIAEAPQRDSMAAIMTEAGLKDCRWESLTLGVVTVYWASK